MTALAALWFYAHRSYLYRFRAVVLKVVEDDSMIQSKAYEHHFKIHLNKVNAMEVSYDGL